MTNQHVDVVRTITLPVSIGDSRVGLVFGVLPDLAAPFLIETSFIDRFVQGIFPHERKIVTDSSKLVPILSIKDLRAVHKDKDKTQDVMIKEKDARRMVSGARHTKLTVM